MKKFIIVACLATSIQSQAQESGFGIGLVIGDPTGISMKGWLSGDRAIAGAVAWSLGNNGHSSALHLQADYLFHKFDLINVGKGKLPLYFGPGVRMRFWGGSDYYRNGNWETDGGSVDLAARFPVGLDYLFEGAPVDVFFELAPTLALIPSTWFEMDFGLGARYWF